MDKELLNLLPERYYVGQVIDNKKFEDLSDNTEFLNKRIRAYVRKITILYTIRNSNNTNEIQVINVVVTTNEINHGDITELIRAIQRGVLYKTVIILASEKDEYDKYKIAIPFCHSGVNKDIMVIDSCEETHWFSKYDMLSVFEEAAALLNNGKNDISLIRDKIVEKVRKYPADRDFFFEHMDHTYVEVFNTMFTALSQEEIESILYDTENENLLDYYSSEEDENFDDSTSDNSRHLMLEEFSKRNLIVRAIEEKELCMEKLPMSLEKINEFFEEKSDKEIIELYEDYMVGWYDDFLEEKEWKEFIEDDEFVGEEEYLKTIGAI